MNISSARQALAALVQANPELSTDSVQVAARGLKTKEAIGEPDRQDFPLITGKEVLVQAEIGDSAGQAFTADPITFSGTVADVLRLTDDRPGHEALVVAVLNAVTCKLGLTDHTIHCRDNEPEECGHHISQVIMERHGQCKIGIVGFQPAIIENCVRRFGTEYVHATDLNPDNVGKIKYGIEIWDGACDTTRLAQWADVMLVTGTVLANKTFMEVLTAIADKPCYFYGTTVAGMAALNELKRICPMSR